MVDTPATTAAFDEQFANLRWLRDKAAGDGDSQAAAAFDMMIADLHRIARAAGVEAGG